MACASSDDNVVETSTPEAALRQYYDQYAVEIEGAATASLEERIWLSDVIVRANLTSAQNGVLNFSAVEYLKGTGPITFQVNAETANRPTTWDSQEAVLFLKRAATGSAPLGRLSTVVVV